MYSPFNPVSNTLPNIIKGEKTIGYLSVNENLSGAVDPYSIKKHVKKPELIWITFLTVIAKFISGS